MSLAARSNELRQVQVQIMTKKQLKARVAELESLIIDGIVQADLCLRYSYPYRFPQAGTGRWSNGAIAMDILYVREVMIINRAKKVLGV
jgi:hypothetical protein